MKQSIVVFQGVAGAYSDAAARELLNVAENTHVKPVGLSSFELCFRAVTSGEADYACLPMENTMGGSISDNFDLQLKNSLFSTAEIHLPVRHCLLALKGQRKEDIKTVISHPQALAQCADYLQRELPWAVAKPESDTAGSAQLIAEKHLAGYAAIASATASSVYGLEIVEENIQDASDNYTRFLLYSTQPIDPRSAVNDGIKMKCSIVFTILNQPGTLHDAIEPFARHRINLTKLESRPDRRRGRKSSEILRQAGPLELLYGQDFLSSLPVPVAEDEQHQPAGDSLFKAMFFLDMVMSPGANLALREVAMKCPFFRVLGCYPADGVLVGHVANTIGCPDGTNFTRGRISRHLSLTSCSPTPSPSPPPEESSSKRVKHTGEGLAIGILGFGNFGQFLAKKFVSQNHSLSAWSRSAGRYHEAAQMLRVTLYSDLPSLLQTEKPDVLIVSTSILSFEQLVMEGIPKELVGNCLLVDVLSVKTLAKRVFTQAFKDFPQVDLLCTHPMFGPESAKRSWRDLPFVFEKVRIANLERCHRFLDIFQHSGCEMVELSCEEHDEKAANSQFVTHFTGRVLKDLHLRQTGIDTKGFLSLLGLVENTCKDSDDLFVALFRHNPNAACTLSAIRDAVEGVTARLRRTDEPSSLLSDLVNRISPSKTVKVHGLAMELARQGKDVITTLTVGEPNFGPPQAAMETVAEKVHDPKATKYTPSRGILSLREAIAADYQKRKGVVFDAKSEILVSGGGKQSIFQAINALCGSGDEVIVPAPYWVSYPDICRIGGSKPVIVHREAKHQYLLQPDQLEAAITPRTKMLILCNPCNPTGCLYEEKHLRALVSVLQKYPHVWILADEIYERIIYENCQHVSFASLLPERTLVVNGIAKGFAMTGLRIGWLCGPPKIISACEKLQSQINSSACSLSQHAAESALHCSQDPLESGPGKQNLANLDQNRTRGFDLLSGVDGVETVKGKGAFYFFVKVARHVPQGLTCEKLCEYLIRMDSGVALVPGDAFGDPPEACSFRMSYACSQDDMERGIERFKKGLTELRHGHA